MDSLVLRVALSMWRERFPERYQLRQPKEEVVPNYNHKKEQEDSYTLAESLQHEESLSRLELAQTLIEKVLEDATISPSPYEHIQRAASELTSALSWKLHFDKH